MSCFHKPHCLVACIMGHTRGDVELPTDSMTAVCSVYGQTKSVHSYPFYSMNLVMTLPTSRYMVPGLQMVMASSRHW